MTASPKGRIPVVVVSGFLGSGKTTLLRTALTGDPHTAVIVNEFGAVSLDHRLLRNCEERVEVVRGGCACCAKRADLAATLRTLLDDHERGRADLRRVVIETSGLADPAPIIFTVTSDPMLRHHFDVARVTVCVDAVNGLGQLAAHPEALKQVAVADELVITKVDLVERQVCLELADRLSALNPGAVVLAARHGIRDASVSRRPGAQAAARRPGAGGLRRAGPGNSSQRRLSFEPAEPHADDIHSVLIPAHEPLDWLGFAVWLSMLLAAWGERVLRVKGLIELNDGAFVSINGVQHIVHKPEHLEAREVPDGPSGIVFIIRGLDGERLRESLQVFQRIAG